MVIAGYEQFYDDFYKKIMIISRSMASISVICSCYIITDLIIHRKKKLFANNVMTNRIIFGVSLYDLLYSFTVWILFSFPMRTGTSLGSMGNITTCTIQGFFAQVAIIGSVSFNVSLSICYVLIVTYGWNSTRLMKMQHAFLTAPVLLSVILAIPPLFDNSYNFNVFNCQIAPHPFLCDPTEGDPAMPSYCERGRNSKIFVTMSLVVTFSAGIINVVSMIALYRFVLQQETRSNRHVFDGNEDRSAQNTYSKRVAVQGVFYFIAFALAWWDYYFYFIYVMIYPTSPIPIWCNYTTVVFVPLQGFFNAFVYLRPRYVAHRRNASSTAGQTGNELIKKESKLSEKMKIPIAQNDTKNNETNKNVMSAMKTPIVENDKAITGST